MGNFKEDIARCEAFVFDVDGVMTDGGIIPTADGDFIRRYNAKDGYALAYAVKHGYKVCIITGGRGRTLEHRLRMLGIERFYTDCMDKIRAMREYFAEEGIDPANACLLYTSCCCAPPRRWRGCSSRRDSPRRSSGRPNRPCRGAYAPLSRSRWRESPPTGAATSRPKRSSRSGGTPRRGAGIRRATG